MKNPAAIETLRRLAIEQEHAALDDEDADEDDKKKARRRINQFRRMRSAIGIVRLLSKTCWDAPCTIDALIHAIDGRAPTGDYLEFDT